MAKRELDIVLNGKDRVSSTIGKVENRLGKFVAVAGAAVAAASLTATAALGAQVREQFNVIDSAAKMSDRLGISTEKLLAYQHAAKLAGIESRTLEMAIQRMTRRVAEAAQGGGEGLGAILELGLDPQVLARQSPDRALLQIADAMSRVENQGDRVRLAFKLFDSEGVAMVQMLQQGSSELRAAEAEARRLGLTMSRDAAAGVEAANDAITRMRGSVTGLARDIAVELAPSVEQAASFFSDIVQGFSLSAGDVVTAERGRDVARVLSELSEARRRLNDLSSRTGGGQGSGRRNREIRELREQIPLLRQELHALTQLSAKAREVEEINQQSTRPISFFIDEMNAANGQATFVESFLGDYKKGLQSFADELRRATQTPAEAFNEQIALLREALREGVIDEELFARGVRKAREELASGREGHPTGRRDADGSLARLDNARFTTGLGGRQRQERQADEALRLAKVQTREQERMNERLAAIEQSLVGNTTPVILGANLR